MGLAVDPFVAYIWWEASPEDLARSTGTLAVLRFSDVTGVAAGQALGHFDVQIDLQAAGRYVTLLSPRRSYRVDLGLAGSDGTFVGIARSDVIDTPPDATSSAGEYRSRAVTGNEESMPAFEPALEGPGPPSGSPPVPQPPPASGEAAGGRADLPGPGERVWTDVAGHLGEGARGLDAPAADPAAETSGAASGPVDAAHIIRQQLAELYRLEVWSPPLPFGSQRWGASGEGVQGMPPEGMDLTGLSEWAYRPGLSSG
ncbi:MAG: DUF4912 domain-containing protein [Actinomycetota bacterium]